MIHNLEKKEFGLSSKNRSFIVVIVVILLLIFGPIESYGMVTRFAYLIIVPILVWLSLRYWGSNWRMDRLSNDRLTRALAAGIAGAFLVGAYLSYASRYHTECDQYINTRDGRECVGDYITVKGSDKSGAFMQIIFAGFAIWFAIAKRSEGED